MQQSVKDKFLNRDNVYGEWQLNKKTEKDIFSFTDVIGCTLQVSRDRIVIIVRRQLTQNERQEILTKLDEDSNDARIAFEIDDSDGDIELQRGMGG